MKSAICFILSMLSAGYAFSQNTYTFRAYSIDNGLSENTVNEIIQDRNGFMWFGTKDGLNRFDGHDFEIYRVGQNYIESICEKDNGALWVGTECGLYHFDTLTGESSIFTGGTENGTCISTHVSSVCRESDGVYWFGTFGQGVFRYDMPGERLTHYAAGRDGYDSNFNIVWTVFRDRSGDIWIGTNNGLSRYNKETDRFFTYRRHRDAGELNDYEVLSIYEDSGGDLWAGTARDGLLRFDRNTQTFTTYLDDSDSALINHIRAISQYDDTGLFVGSADGLYLFDKTTGKPARIDNPADRHSLSDRDVYSIYKDREQGIWIGTYFGGVNYLAPYNKFVKHYYPTSGPGSMSGKIVSQFAEDRKGNIWIGTEDGGINYFEPKTGRFTPYLPEKNRNSLSYHNVQALILDDDKLWIGTISRGLDVLDIKTGRFRNYRHDVNDYNSLNTNAIYSLYKDSRGDVYIGTAYGLHRHDSRNDNFIRFGEAAGFISDMMEDPHGYLWVASLAQGLYRYDYSNGSWKTYRHTAGDARSICSNKLIRVCLDDRQRLWLASEGGGFCRYNYETDDFTTMSKDDGLPSNIIYGILDDRDGNIWVSSNYGISRIEPDSPGMKTYTISDGLQSNQFNYRSSMKSSTGMFYFGGINGFNVFDPEEMPSNEVVPQVRITGLEILSDKNPKKIEPRNDIELRHNENSLVINFASLSFAGPNKNRYAYTLEDDGKWINIGNRRSVSLIGLAPGDYTFRVKASNNNDVWNEEGASVGFTILPPFWLSTAARVVYIVFALVLLSFLVAYSHKIAKRRQQRTLEDYRQRKEKEMYDMKIDFFTNIVHEIRTPLCLIKAPLESIITSGESNRDTQKNLSVIEKNTDRLLELVNQLLDFRKIENDHLQLSRTDVDLNELIGALIFRFNESAVQKGITITVEMPDSKIVTAVNEEAITKIISNLLSNALKYAASGVVVRLQESDDKIELHVEDDGIGIPREVSDKIFEPFYQVNNIESLYKKEGTGLGLALAKQLSDRIGGELRVLDIAKGSLFSLTVSKDKMADVAPGTGDSGDILSDDIFVSAINCNELPKRSLLIVEDNRDLREFLIRELSETYKILAAENGKVAFSLLEAHGVDVIVSDIVMSEMDGIEFTRLVKENDMYSHIPLVLLSAKTDLESKIESLEIGADIYIEKPFSINYLKAQLVSILENHKRLIDRFTTQPLTSLQLDSINKRDFDFVTRLNQVIEDNIADTDFSIEKLGSIMALSRSNLQRKIKGISGMPPNDYIRVIRLKKAAILLNSGSYQINEVCYMVGFNSNSYFAKCFFQQFGMLPKDFLGRLNKDKPQDTAADAL